MGKSRLLTHYPLRGREVRDLMRIVAPTGTGRKDAPPPIRRCVLCNRPKTPDTRAFCPPCDKETP